MGKSKNDTVASKLSIWTKSNHIMNVSNNNYDVDTNVSGFEPW